jgi:hypothetical protein
VVFLITPLLLITQSITSLCEHQVQLVSDDWVHGTGFMQLAVPVGEQLKLKLKWKNASIILFIQLAALKKSVKFEFSFK